MATVRTRQFALGDTSSGPGVNVGTVPVGKRWILKQYSIYNSDVSAVSVHMGVIPSGSSTAYWFGQATIPSDGVMQSPTEHLVLEAGQTLSFYMSPAKHLYWTASGSELTL